ncbi:MAG: threonine synthase [bacterium]
MIEIVCRTCGRKFDQEEPIWQCFCGGLLDVNGRAALPIKKVKERKPSMWRYREMIPIKDEKNIVSFNEGFTPLIEIPVNSEKIYFKMDFLFPTGSFKDRGASVLVSKIKELGIKKVLIDSSGNAGSAVSAYCAKAGIECLVLVPEHTSEEKMTQIKSYGAKLFVVQGNRDETAFVALKLAQKMYYASHYYNPFFFQGTKTFAFEITEQLEWRVPDTLILPVGNGTLLLGAYIGFRELYEQKIINEMPKLVGVQSNNCAPLFLMLKKNINTLPKITARQTIAEGIAVGKPTRANQIISAIRKTKGFIITVSDSEIKNAHKEMRLSGLYIEPTSAAVVAGIKKYLKLHHKHKKELIVSTFTGSGLKSHKK